MNEHLAARIDDLQDQVRAIAESPIFDQKLAELEYRLDQANGRIRTLEARVEHVDLPTRPRKARSR